MAETIIELLKTENYMILAVFISVSILLNLGNIINFYSSHKKRRLNDLQLAVSNNELPEDFRNHLKNEIELEYFKIAHGIKISKLALNAVLVLLHRVGDRLSAGHVIRASRLINNVQNIQNLSFRLELTKFEKYFAIYNIFFGVIFSLFGLILSAIQMVLAIYVFNISSLLSSLFCVFIGFLMFYEGIPLYSIKLINEALTEIEQESVSKPL
ncbi:hypothetical protein [Aliivibrio fischeri]|uniref:hypothetical protein n=1 Tax=Aliivibrio fischeri TaxID=668 RepID=UPI0012D8B4E5|nr:hypothetical protein [Aliivibrio fischeri]MUI54386.1 hypothetical protein [Aliivibrio fischeri]